MTKVPWYIDCKNSELLQTKLNGFFTKHQELSRELAEAKLLGICKTTISEVKRYDSKNQDLIKKSGVATTKTGIIHLKDDHEEETS